MSAAPTKSISFQNFFSATLTGDITASSTDIPMDNIPNGSEGFLVIEPDSTTAREVIYYNSKTSLKVVCPSAADGRGQDDTTAGAHSTGATVIMAPVAAYYEALQSGAGINAKSIYFNTPQGFMQNGVISRTVSGNNITVALKTVAGNDPSTSDPVIVRIGDTIRVITSALSVTKNAGTNWFNAGSAELATQEIDYFVYMGYNATDGVTLGFSRIPYATTYGDFSATTTNGRYAAISTITSAASTDVYEVVGRFNATLSASASYNWSVPATSVIVNRPIFNTRWLTWAVQWSASGSMTISSSTTTARYMVSNKKVDYEIECSASATLGGTASNSILLNLPLSPYLAGSGFLLIGTTSITIDTIVGWVQLNNSGDQAIIRKSDGSNYSTGSGKTLRALGFYEVG